MTAKEAEKIIKKMAGIWSVLKAYTINTNTQRNLAR